MNHICYVKCPFTAVTGPNFYDNRETWTCDPCTTSLLDTNCRDSNCVDCLSCPSGADICETCKNLSYLYISSCLKVCPSTHSGDDTSNTCTPVPCALPCMRCETTDITLCTECYEGRFLYE